MVCLPFPISPFFLLYDLTYPLLFPKKNVFSFIHPDDIINIKTQFAKKNSERYLNVITFRFKNVQGEWRWLESRVTDMSKNPEVNGYIFNTRDVTERKIAEEEIEK